MSSLLQLVFLFIAMLLMGAQIEAHHHHDDNDENLADHAEDFFNGIIGANK